MRRFWILSVVCLSLPAIAASDSDRERRKAEFLKKPIFVETVRKQEREAKEKALFNPNPRPVELPKELRQVPESNFVRRTAPDAREPQSIGKPTSLPANLKQRTDGQCGYNKFVENYCYYPNGKGWLLCTDRWGGCIQQEER